jgi:hypothetical protein
MASSAAYGCFLLQLPGHTRKVFAKEFDTIRYRMWMNYDEFGIGFDGKCSSAH